MEFYHYFKNIITPEKCAELNQIMFDKFDNQQLIFEGNDAHYKNSFGAGSVPEFDALFKEFTPKVIKALRSRFIREENSYSRIYFNGSTLLPHRDRPGLDLTMSLCTYTNLDNPWPIYVEFDNGVVRAVDIKPGDAAIFLGTRMKHWRDPLVCNPDQRVVQSFYHWRISL